MVGDRRGWFLGPHWVRSLCSKKEGNSREKIDLGSRNPSGGAKSYKDAVLANILWPSTLGPRFENINGETVLSFLNGDLTNRLSHLKSCLVGRVVGDNPSPSALREWGKNMWRVGGELQVRRLPKGPFLFYFFLRGGG